MGEFNIVMLKMGYKNGSIVLSVFLFILIAGSLITNNNLTNTFLTNMEGTLGAIKPAQSDYDHIDWIKYGNFSGGADNYWDNLTLGDKDDVNSTIANDVAKYEILGNKSTYSIEALTTNKSNWEVMLNPDFPAYPEWYTIDQYHIDNDGFWTRHLWTETERQTPSVIWTQNVTMDVNMSDYIITSANVSAIFNASVNSNVDVDPNKYDDSIQGSDTSFPQGSVYDYVRFYIKITNPDWFKNPAENPPYTIAFNRTYDLGANDVLEYANTFMQTVGEEDLIYFLTSVLSKDYKNFTIIVGFDIFCEDNCNSDIDYFENLRIKTFSLNFTYEKNIDQLTKVSWNQEAGAIPNNYIVQNATLNFKYKLDSGIWPKDSLNSELRILINNNQLSESINLNNSITIDFKDVKSGGIDVTNFINPSEDVNLSIQLYIGDEFALDRIVNISIDDVSLIIEYELTSIATDVQLWIDGVNETIDKSMIAYWRENISFAVEYTNLSDDFIPDATISINDSGLSRLLQDDGFNNYTIEINTTDLSYGVNYVTIRASKKYYEAQSLSNIRIEIRERTAKVDKVFFNNVEDDDASIVVNSKEYLNINVTYFDQISQKNISGATVKLYSGTNVIGVFTGGFGGIYNLTLNTTDVGIGYWVLSVIANKTDYSTATKQIRMEVTYRSTNLTLYVNEDEKTQDKSLTVNWNETISIAVCFNDTTSDTIITEADVNINGTNLSDVLSFVSNRYEFSFNSQILGVGTHYLTIEAKKSNYTSQTIVLKVQVTIRDTTFKTYVNGIDKTVEQSYKILYNELITISVVYNDTTSNQYINDAIVSVNGTGISSLIQNYGTIYQITINSATLGTGIAFLTIEALKNNYETQSLVLTIDVIERATDFYIEINSLNKTLDKSIEVPIRSLINITVSYFDENTGSFIPGASLSLIGENISIDFTENATLRQYSALVNSTDLDIGVRFLTVTAQKPNYESFSARLRIQVNRIRTEIEIESGNETMTALPGENVILAVSLHDLDYGGSIENVTVMYSTDFEQGELLDPDGDGVFEAVLTNVPEGTYQITVSVYADDDYDFERLKLNLNVIRSPENVLLFQVLTVIGIGAAIGIGGYLVLYQKIFRYPVPVRKVRKFKKALRKKKLPSVDISSRDAAFESKFKEEISISGKIIEESEKLKVTKGFLKVRPKKKEETQPEESPPIENGDSPETVDTNENPN